MHYLVMIKGKRQINRRRRVDMTSTAMKRQAMTAAERSEVFLIRLSSDVGEACDKFFKARGMNRDWSFGNCKVDS
jgi:hypothetical protein